MKILKWYEYCDDIQLLIKKIENLNLNINKIYAIPRGGLIPATIISHYFDDIPIVTKIEDFDFDTYNKILVIDDLCHTGYTMKNLIKVKMDNVFTAALYVKRKSSFIPDLYIEGDIPEDEWILFPYDNEIKSEDELTEDHYNKVNSLKNG